MTANAAMNRTIEAQSGQTLTALDPAVDPRGFRNALGSYPTGVTVVTTQTNDGPLGITANSFASVSLDPPLVLWSPARASARHAAFVGAEHFAIHVLSAEQRALCEQFTRNGRDWTGLSWSEAHGGTPVLTDVATAFLCRREVVHAGGDHDIIIGRVLQVLHAQDRGAPLVFHSGRYGGFDAV